MSRLIERSRSWRIAASSSGTGWSRSAFQNTKWKFRLAPNLIVQIQPVLPKASARIKDNALILSGLACMRDSVGLDAFLTREDSAACWSTGFQIKDWWRGAIWSVGRDPPKRRRVG
jgi:hypothetical protein